MRGECFVTTFGRVKWSRWRPFPDPRKGELLMAPFGPGCYELRHGRRLLLFGKGNHVAHRMTSLLPHPLGCGTRKNERKRRYVLKHVAEIEYRTLACATSKDAGVSERVLKRNRAVYLFGT